MKLTKKLEEEVMQVYDTWLNSYLTGDIKTYDYYFDDEYRFIGSTGNEEFLNRKDTTNFFEVTAVQLAGKTDIRNSNKTIELFGELIFITQLLDAWFLNGNEWAYYGRFRFTSVLRKNDDGWRFIYQHFSAPDLKAAEGETIGYEKISAENLELREAVKRRTIELNEKNWELEIEVALEKVRAIAMSMTQPADMLEVCKIISGQLKQLGVKEIRNVQTAIINEAKGTYLNYEFYAEHKKLFTTEVDYKNNKIQTKFAVQMLTGTEELFTEILKGKKLKDWYAYQQTTNQFVDKYLEQAESLNYYWYSLGPVALGISTYASLTDDEINLFKRFRNVFELAYRRFLDIEKAEAQAREAQIELALERVRARTMAMQSSNELQETATVLFQEFKKLGAVDVYQVTIGLYNEEEGIIDFRVTNWGGRGEHENRSFKLSMDEPTVLKPAVTAWKANKKSMVFDLTGNKLEEWLNYRNKISGTSVRSGDTGGRRVISAAFFSKGHLTISTPLPVVPEMVITLERFAVVFDATYTRFLDLQKAEAQLREAKIEAALEKVRSRSMGMQKSEELKEVIEIVYQQLTHLKINLDHAGFVVDYIPRGDWHFWIADKHEVPAEITVPYFDSVWGICYNEAKEKGIDFFATHLNFEEKNKFYQDLLKHIPGLPEEAKEFYFSCPGLAASTVLLDDVGLYIENFSGTTYTEEENDTLMRFGKVFQQTYTRFLDLQKAEAQAREATIEAALERVRYRAMAMQNSEDVWMASATMFDELDNLGIETIRCGILTGDESEAMNVWSVSKSVEGKVMKGAGRIDMNSIQLWKRLHNSWKQNEEFYFCPLAGEEKDAYYRAIANTPNYLRGTIGEMPDQFLQGYFFTEGIIWTFSQHPHSEEDKNVLKKFTNVFALTFRRYNDLKQAEAQTREAKIETALEKIRSRTMAMQHSDELQNAAILLFQQVQSLGIKTGSCGFFIWMEDKKSAMVWNSSQEGGLQIPFKLPHTEIPHYKRVYEAAKKGDEFHVEEVAGEALEKQFNYLRKLDGIKKIIKKYEDAGFALPSLIIYHDVFFKQGYLSFHTHEPAVDAHDIFKRFGKVFEQTYTRFLDLQKAEAQTREAKIEAALERVRARALAMQEPEELKDVAEVLRHEMGLLGVEELETCSIYINDVNAEKAECWYALKDVQREEKKLVNDYFELDLNDTWVGREMLQFYNLTDKQTSIVMQGTNRKEWINYCEEKSVPFRGYYGELIPDRTYHLYKFSHGAIGAATPGNISDESFGLLKRTASVFSLAYSRFKDLTQARTDLQKLKEEKKRAEDALTELQAAQKQLIQSEKMASLGELTAGIAHEIQNPLNFVNNFSEVNMELIDELKTEVRSLAPLEMTDNKLEMTEQLIDDIKANSEKINHHGQRAADIVKGMLQHSRSSSGVKEPTDINSLCDEYLRLSYHGLRAKDKNFNATIKTDFDASLEKVNIIPQDIGRVVLNLLTNAFYAVGEKSSIWNLQSGNKIDAYTPTVSVSTKKVDSKVEIKVTDNGNGIPQKVLDKIFQPFFTTKPTGQGTGLGLSLSYDIVKAHGGELNVETKEEEARPDDPVGRGSTFIIQLPINHS